MVSNNGRCDNSHIFNHIIKPFDLMHWCEITFFVNKSSFLRKTEEISATLMATEGLISVATAIGSQHHSALLTSWTLNFKQSAALHFFLARREKENTRVTFGACALGFLNVWTERLIALWNYGTWRTKKILLIQCLFPLMKRLEHYLPPLWPIRLYLIWNYLLCPFNSPSFSPSLCLSFHLSLI